MNRFQPMIGRVGSDPCKQLRGLLHSQETMLRSKEVMLARDDVDIAELRQAIETTRNKLRERGC